MSLSLALSNALTGLQANSKQVDLISSNVSNALTEGYSRRNAALSEIVVAGAGAGVGVEAIERATSPAASDARRLAEAASGRTETLAAASDRLAGIIGDPGDPAALASVASRLDNALASAADTPESASFLSNAAAAAADYAASINRIAVEVVTLRTEIDASIARQVSAINNALDKIQSINSEIQQRHIVGADITALEDQRERLIRQVSDLIPVKVIRRENEQVALYGKNGGQLLDGKVFELGFSPTQLVGPGQTLANGALSGLTSDGRAITIGAPDGSGLLDGGSLAASFELRDSRLPAIGDDLDALAEDLILRTQGLAEDPTITPGDAGLFTDQGAAYAVTDRLGLALRIEVNASIDPFQGGLASRLRDGVAAVTPGDAGSADVLRGLQNALSSLTVAPGGSTLAGSRSSTGFATQFASAVLLSADNDTADAVFEQSRLATLSDAEKADTGVDTDQELSRLLAVEQAYAANARVIQVVDDLLERLTSI